MENQITFFTFKDVRRSYSENLHQIRQTIAQKKVRLNNKKIELKNILKKNRKLSDDEIATLSNYKLDLTKNHESNALVIRDFITANKGFRRYSSSLIPSPTIKEFQNQIEVLVKEDKSRKKTYLDLNCDHQLQYYLSSDDILKLKKLIFSKAYKSLKKKYDIQSIIESEPHEPFAQEIRKLEKEIAELKAFISEFEGKERIDAKDIESLNDEIQQMNKEGWSVKQMEGIQSGKAGSVYDGGYGYSFTEGVLILWEKRD